jgi:hypothetical protein
MLLRFVLTPVSWSLRRAAVDTITHLHAADGVLADTMTELLFTGNADIKEVCHLPHRAATVFVLTGACVLARDA